MGNFGSDLIGDPELEGLVSVDGGSRTTTLAYAEKDELGPAQAGLYLARPQVLYRPDVALLYGSPGAQGRIRSVRFGERDLLVSPRSAIEGEELRGAICGHRLEQMDNRTLEPAGFLELLVENGQKTATYRPVVLGYAVTESPAWPSGPGQMTRAPQPHRRRDPKMARVPLALRRTIDKHNEPLVFEVPAAHRKDGELRYGVRAVETVMRWPTPVCALQIITEGLGSTPEADDLYVSDFKVGKDSQLPTPDPWPVELFRKPLAMDTDVAQTGVVVTVAIGNRCKEKRHFRFVLYLEPPREP